MYQPSVPDHEYVRMPAHDAPPPPTPAQRGAVPVDVVALPLGVVQLDRLKQLTLVLGSEHAVRDLTQELLQHGRDRVYAETGGRTCYNDKITYYNET